MDQQGFRQFLHARQMAEDKIEEAVSLAGRFEELVAGSRQPGDLTAAAAADVRAFSQRLIQEHLNTYDNYIALARYGRFVGNNRVYVAVIEMLDGSEALGNLHARLGEVVGANRRDEVFAGVSLPPLGTQTTELPRYTQAVMERLEAMVDSATYERILSPGLRDLKDEWFLEEREKYRAAGSVDAYLEQKGREFIAELERLKREGKLFFTQEITDAVIDFVRAHPEVESGVRQGNVVYHTKIPHMAKEYLAEADERMKRYYYCHCPWVKESLKAGDVHISPTFCQCSAGFVKKPWEVVFDQPLRADVLETVLTGGLWCRFAIHLPEVEA